MHLAYKRFEIKSQANITLRFCSTFLSKMNIFYIYFNNVWIQRSCVKIYTWLDGKVDQRTALLCSYEPEQFIPSSCCSPAWTPFQGVLSGHRCGSMQRVGVLFLLPFHMFVLIEDVAIEKSFVVFQNSRFGLCMILLQPKTHITGQLLLYFACRNFQIAKHQPFFPQLSNFPCQLLWQRVCRLCFENVKSGS